MILLDQIRLARNNVVRAGMRTTLCVLAICIGIASVSTITSMGTTAGDAIQNELNNIGVRGVAVYTKTGEALSEEALQVMAQTKEISAYMPLILTSGTVRLRDQASAAGILGIDHRLDQVFQLTVLHGALPTRGQVAAGERIAVIDEELAQKAYKRTNVVGKDLWISVNGVSEKLEVCAVIRSQSAGISALLGGNVPHILYIPYTALNALSADLKIDKAILIPENIDPTVLSEELIGRLEHISSTDYRYENLDHYLASFSSITNILTVLVGGVAVISVIVGGLGVMNTMMASIDARTREIGIYRALGAKRRDIIRIFLIESVFLCLIGGILGVLLNWSIFIGISALLDIHIKLQTGGVLLSIAMASLCGVCFGWLPAIRAANLDPIQAIRSE